MDKNHAKQGRNRLIDALPAKERAPFIAKTERISLGTKELLYEANTPIHDVYFPLSGVMSMISVADKDTFLEVATVGNEGVLGVPIVLGSEHIPFRVFAQVPGDAFKMPSTTLRQEIAQSRALQDIMNLYLQALFTQMGQSVACNRLHSIEQRFARWMLMTRDRVQSNEFPITQEFIALMLGARRASINEVAVQMQSEGLIDYTRGRMKITHPEGLESRACVCYCIIKDEYDNFLKDG